MKQEAPVKLPSGPFIHYVLFCRALADSILPQEKHFSGIKCVFGKSIRAEEVIPYRDSIPYALTESDQKYLLQALRKLPPLKFGMSSAELGKFFEVWESMSPALEWKPLIWTEENSMQRRYNRKTLELEFVRALRIEFDAGRLVAVGPNHVPVRALEMAALITRQSAIEFLTRHAFIYEEELGKEKSIDSAEVYKRSKQYKAEGLKNPTQKLAAEFGRSDSYIRRIVRDEEKRQNLLFPRKNT